MTVDEAPAQTPMRRVSRRGVLVFVVAGLAVIAAAIFGVRGLLASPVVSTRADGTATLQGTWEPYSCGVNLCEGYVQAGARSVFVVLRSGCPRPPRAADITVDARLDRTLGSASYRATTCPS